MARKNRTRAAFQGELGAFSHAAARKFLGEGVELQPCARFDDVFQALRSDSVTHAVIPIENTLHGSVHENYDHLLEYDVPIVAETSIRISHQLIAMPGTKFRDLRRAYSHPVAINQCLRFFSTHTQIEQAPYYDTAGSVKMLRDERPEGAAAIASVTAAEIYGGIILKRNIEDDRRNFTRFFLLTKQANKLSASTDGWKTSVVLSTPNRPGSLFKVMACFALRDLNLTKIESRPLRGKPWEYLFYIDIQGHKEDEAIQNALRHLGEITQIVKVLGSYQALH
ncbi:MAG: prephenate dehydratase [Bryobacteraceae bacterium]